jgi:uncharacterized protein (UPF0335 family)
MSEKEKKPIQQMSDDIKDIKRDVIGIKMDLIYIKDYIRRKNEQKELEHKQELAKDAEYVKTGWFW